MPIGQLPDPEGAGWFPGIGSHPVAGNYRYSGTAGPGQQRCAFRGPYHVVGAYAPGHLNYQVHFTPIVPAPPPDYQVSQQKLVSLALRELSLGYCSVQEGV